MQPQKDLEMIHSNSSIIVDQLKNSLAKFSKDSQSSLINTQGSIKGCVYELEKVRKTHISPKLDQQLKENNSISQDGINALNYLKGEGRDMVQNIQQDLKNALDCAKRLQHVQAFSKQSHPHQRKQLL